MKSSFKSIVVLAVFSVFCISTGVHAKPGNERKSKVGLCHLGDEGRYKLLRLSKQGFSRHRHVHAAFDVEPREGNCPADVFDIWYVNPDNNNAGVFSFIADGQWVEYDAYGNTFYFTEVSRSFDTISLADNTRRGPEGPWTIDININSSDRGIYFSAGNGNEPFALYRWADIGQKPNYVRTSAGGLS